MGQPPKREIERLKREKREAKAARKRKKTQREYPGHNSSIPDRL